MDEAKLGISDMNFGTLEGRVIGTPNENTTTDGRKTINFCVETMKIGSDGKKYYNHNVVAFGAIAEKYAPYIKNNVFVRVEYHLIAQSITVGTGETAKTIQFSKPAVNFIQIEE